MLDTTKIYSKQAIDAIDAIDDKRFSFYVQTLSHIYDSIFNEMLEKNKSRIGEDEFTIATNVDEMIYIAKYIYILRKYNVPGDVLECGCFQGFSSCCLSWATTYCGYNFIVADSFEGLPDVGHAVYKPSEYTGTIETVTRNINTYGIVSNVELTKGWFKDSLQNFTRPLSMLWMDVDLFESTLDVLNNVFSNLHENGIILCHEFHENLEASEVFQACRYFFNLNGIEVKMERLVNNLGIIYRTTN